MKLNQAYITQVATAGAVCRYNNFVNLITKNIFKWGVVELSYACLFKNRVAT